jgi:hypothetical protein
MRCIPFAAEIIPHRPFLIRSTMALFIICSERLQLFLRFPDRQHLNTAVATRPRRRGDRVSGATTQGKNRIMIFGPKDDGTYVVEFKTAEGEALAISIPRSETVRGCSCRTR